jgi:hypothetical protein
VHELAAAVGEDALSWLRLEGPDRLDDVVPDDGGVAPDRLVKASTPSISAPKVAPMSSCE